MSEHLAVSHKTAVAASRELLSKYNLLRPEFFKEFKTTVALILVPYEVFRFSWIVNWSASFGYDRKETYWVNEWDAKTQSHQNLPKQRTVTDWRPASGISSGLEDILTSSSDAIPYEQEIKLRNRLRNVVSFEEDRFDITHLHKRIAPLNNESFKVHVAGSCEAIVSQDVKGHSKGDRQKDWSWSFQEKIVERGKVIYYPVYEVIYSNGSESYSSYVDGLNDTNVVHASDLPKEGGSLVKIIIAWSVAAAFAIMLLIIKSEFLSTSLDKLSAANIKANPEVTSGSNWLWFISSILAIAMAASFHAHKYFSIRKGHQSDLLEVEENFDIERF